MSVSPEECGREVLETVLAVMRTVRAEMRQFRQAGLTMSQFRVLFMMRKHPGVSLTFLADRLGLSLPAMSQMVDLLVERGLLTRQPCEDDRRRVELRLTAEGSRLIQAVRLANQQRLALSLATLPDDERDVVWQAMQLLNGVFGSREGGCEQGAAEPSE